MPTSSTGTFRDLPFMGVIHVNNEAAKAGWVMGDPNWTNLGQGMPEVGEVPGCPPRLSRIDLQPSDHAYGPVEGLPDLRQAVADYYNRLFRTNHASKYTIDNVAIASGGRLALSRIGAAMGACRLGYFTPDYTAYEDLLTTFDRLDPVHIELTAANGFAISPRELESRVERDRLNALLISNPCNPTGVVIDGPELAAWCDLARRRSVTLLMDEFYSHFHYSSPGVPAKGPVSAASYVNDVNSDPVIIIDGLTKCFRYPGWRVGWVVAPKHVIRTLTAAGSFLDGGPGRPIQRAAIEVLQPARADHETGGMRAHFARKHKLTMDTLSALGITFPGPVSAARGTFYAWGDLSKLPAPIRTGEGFMRHGFKHRVLVVPGVYFDVNPGKTRTGPSPLEHFARFSFGPPLENLEAGLNRLGEMVRSMR